MHETDLAGLVCARLCHDLSNPLGAVLNGADLMREMGRAGGGEELEMLERSARRASALLRFHRVAFGVVRDGAASLARSDLIGRAEEVLASPRVTLDCSAPEGPPISAAAARLAALLLLAGRAMLGMGGTLRIVLPTGGDLPIAVMAEGERAGASDDQRRWLGVADGDGDGPAPDAPEVEFALIPAAAAAAGARLELTEDGGRLPLRALPA